jgi:hypothetical protein
VIPGRHARITGLLTVILLAGIALSTTALESVSLKLGHVAGPGWSLDELESRLVRRDTERAALLLTATRARLPEPLGTIAGLQLDCPDALIAADEVACSRARLTFSSDRIGPQQVRTGFSYRFSDRRLVLDLANIRLDGGHLSAHATQADHGWNLTLQADGLQLGALSARLAAAGMLPFKVDGTGTLELSAKLKGKAAHLDTGQLSARLESSAFSDAEGLLAGENLELRFEADAAAAGTGWRINLDLGAQQGQIYVDPVFVDMAKAPLHARARLEWHPAHHRIRLHAFDYEQKGTLSLHANGSLDLDTPAAPEALSVEVREGVFPGLYDTYFQPWLNDTVLRDLHTEGSLSALLQWQDGGLASVRLRPENLTIHDREGRFGIGDLQGQINWAGQGQLRESQLAWEQGHVYRIPLGRSQLRVESTGPGVRLLEPARITVLDGALQVEEFELETAAGAVSRWHVDGILTPVSMTDLTRALGWPEFGGKLSGVIPNVNYRDGDLSVGGMLLVRVFDGEVTLSNLRLAQPLSVVPRLWVDARASNIDLETLTRTFSFGRIEGRLDGRVDKLYMEAWRPVAFDAAFATPEGDKSRHRISQKAVDNISSIGGGGLSGALSRSFMRFFEDFPYDRLGLSCRLENGTCEMDGVAPAANGYYIVKSRLLPPRLDVIGYAERVDWDSLVSQLVAVTRRQGAVVK